MNDDTLKGEKAMSWLVRCWEEPSERAQEPPILRCSIRDLRTGEERYFSDPRELGEMMLRQMKQRKAGSWAEGQEPAAAIS